MGIDESGYWAQPCTGIREAATETVPQVKHGEFGPHVHGLMCLAMSSTIHLGSPEIPRLLGLS